MGNFCFVFLILRNLPMEIWEIVGIYVARVVLTNAHLGFRGILPTFYRGNNINFGQNFQQGSELEDYFSTTGRNIGN